MDTSADIERLEHLNVELQFVSRSLIVYTFFYGCTQVGFDAAGVQLFELLKNTFERDRVEDDFRNNLVSVSIDNFPAMVIEFYAAVKRWMPNTNECHVPCTLHRNELAFKHAYLEIEFIILIDHILNKLYAFYQASSKSTAHLIGTKLEEADTRFHIHRLFKIRWVSPRYRTCSVFISHFKTIATDLNAIAKDYSFRPDSRYMAGEIYTNITD